MGAKHRPQLTFAKVGGEADLVGDMECLWNSNLIQDPVWLKVFQAAGRSRDEAMAHPAPLDDADTVSLPPPQAEFKK